MIKECDRVSAMTGLVVLDKFVNRRCRKNAEALLTMLDMIGLYAYERAQKKHCDCVPFE